MNSTPLPPVPRLSSLDSPAHSMPVALVTVDTGHLTPLIVPIFFSMPLMGEGTLNVDDARPIEVEEGGAEKGGKAEGKQASEEVMPEAGPTDPKEVSKEKIDLLARFIAKEVIPEKLNNLPFVRTPHINHSIQPPTQPSKDDKTAVEQAKKDPENSNLAVPKESVKPAADQSSYSKSSDATASVPIEQEGMVESLRDKKQPEHFIPVQKVIVENRNVDSPVLSKKAAVEEETARPFIKPEPKKSSEHAKIVEKEKPSQKEESKVKNSEGRESQDNSKVDPSKNQGAPIFVKGEGLPVYDPLKRTPNEQPEKDHKPSNSVSEVEAGKQAKPRRDAIPFVDKNESISVQQMYKFVDESLIARMPIMPDFPLSREAILRQAGAPKNARLREDQGYRLGDLVLMMLSAVLGGAKNTTEVCRYLLSKEKFFKVWMGIKNAMPTYRMLWFVLNRLEPKVLEALLQESIGMRPSKVVDTIHVWESHRGFTLGEFMPLTPNRNSELLLDVLDLIDSRGAMVNIESPLLNKAAARKVKLNGGEYILTLRGAPYEHAREFLANGIGKVSVDQYRDVTQEGTSTFIREIEATDDLSWFEEHEEWPYLQSLVKLNSESIQGHRVVLETRMYLSSLPMQADRMAQILRIFSVIEGKVSWMADFDFLAQGSKEFRENESLNMEIFREFSTGILAKDTTDSSSIEAKRKKVRESNDYLRQLIKNL